MSNPLVRAPRLPNPTPEYDRQYMEALISSIRLYFNELDNPGAMLASTQDVDNKITTALSFSQQDPVPPNALRVSLPTQADLARLKTGDVYYDTSASNVLKVKI